ncbi:MAG: DUF5655 domain-containing protein [Thermoanaerobaculia bacterium]
MKRERFRSTVFEGHKGPGFEVPFDPAERWGVAPAHLGQGRNGHRVRGTVNGAPFESVIVPRMRRFFVMLDTATPGQIVEVSLEPVASGQPGLDQHFAGRDSRVRRIYDRIIAAAKKFGPFHEEPKKTSIHLLNKTAFGGVATRKDALILTIKSDRDLNNERVARRNRASANRWHLEVRLSDPSDVDNELKAWLKKAYELSA